MKPPAFHNQILFRQIACCLVVVALALGGCAQKLNLRGDKFNDEYSNWGAVNRPVDNSNGVYMFSNKAQQIENNLGVR